MAKDILERLRHRIDVYGRIPGETEFGEVTYDYEKITTVWAGIIPITGKENIIPGETIQAAITHRITVRKGAIKEPRNDMYFMFGGQKYRVLYFTPNFRRNDLIEFYCKLTIETEEDY